MSHTSQAATGEFELEVDERSKLVLRRPGQDDVADVRVRRSFPWSDPGGSTIWSVGAEAFGPDKAPFMINYRVDDVRGLVKVLKDEGCDVMDQVDESEYGVFGWVVDPEGNKVELWQPPREL